MGELEYTGGGYGGFRPGIPARDLTAEEVARLGGEDALLATGLYRRIITVEDVPAEEPAPEEVDEWQE